MLACFQLLPRLIGKMAAGEKVSQSEKRGTLSPHFVTLGVLASSSSSSNGSVGSVSSKVAAHLIELTTDRLEEDRK